MEREKHEKSAVAESIKATTGLVKTVRQKDRPKVILYLVIGAVAVFAIVYLGKRGGTRLQANVGVQNNAPVQTQINYASNVNYNVQTMVVQPDPNSPFYNALRTGAFNPEKVATLPQMLAAMNAYTTQAEEAFENRNRDSLITCGSMAGAAAVKAMDEIDRLDGPYSDEFKEKLARTSRMHFEATLTGCQYDEMWKFADRTIGVYGDRPPADVFARHSMAKMLKNGQVIFQPSNEEMRSLKERGKDFTFDYLNSLARYGVLFPRRVDVMNPSQKACSYDSYFGFDRELEYQPVYLLKTKDDDGNPMQGDELTQRYVGLGRYATVDLTDGYCKYAEAGDGVRRRLEYSQVPGALDGFSVESLINTIAVDVKVEEAQGLNYDERREREVSLCRVEPDGHEIVLARQMQCVPVPEPVSGLLLVLGCAVVALRRRR